MNHAKQRFQNAMQRRRNTSFARGGFSSHPQSAARLRHRARPTLVPHSNPKRREVVTSPLAATIAGLLSTKSIRGGGICHPLLCAGPGDSAGVSPRFIPRRSATWKSHPTLSQFDSRPASAAGGTDSQLSVAAHRVYHHYLAQILEYSRDQ